MRLLLACTVFLVVQTAPAIAQDRMIDAGRVPPDVLRPLVQALTNPRTRLLGLGQLSAYFQVPSEAVSYCILTTQGELRCVQYQQWRECPDEIALEVPGQTEPVDIPVDCVGPDADGNCECEVATEAR